MKNAFLFLSIIVFLNCTDKNVKTVGKKLYEVDGVYLKMVQIDGAKIFFVTDSLGNPIAGTSTYYTKTQNNSVSSTNTTTILTNEN